MMYYYGDFGFHPFFGGIMMLLFWVLVIGGIVWIIRTATTQNGNATHTQNHNSALDILRERYARGEINKEEFDAKKKDLMD